MYERFTDRARKVMQLASQEARRFDHEFVGTEHILLGVVAEGAGVAANVLKNLDIDLRKIRHEVEKIVQTGPSFGETPAAPVAVPLTPRAKKVVEYAIDEAKHLGHNYVGSEHILLGLLREDEGVAAQVLANLNVTHAAIREEVMNLLGHPVGTGEPTGPAAKAKAKCDTPALSTFGRDLTAAAHQGDADLGPPSGRAAEMRRVVRAVACRRPRPVVLLSDSRLLRCGAAVGLARATAELPLGDAFGLARVVVLDVPRLMRAESRTALGRALVDLHREAKSVRAALFADDLHVPFRAEAVEWEWLLLGCRAGSVPFVGATTEALYRRHVEPFSEAFGGFRVIALAPATAAEAIALATAERGRIEAHYRVSLTDGAIRTAVELCAGGLPDAAVDALDEAAAGVRLAAVADPPDCKALEAEIGRLNAEKESAVCAGDYETAARCRDAGETARREKEQRMAAWLERAMAGNAVVDEAAVRAVAAAS